MGLTGPIASSTYPGNKDLAQGYQPLLLVAFTFQGSSTPLLLSTHPLDGVGANPTFPGIGTAPAGAYAGRIAQQDIDAIQHRSPQGIDRINKFAVHIYDADFTIYNTYAKVYGFRGATMQVWLVLWQVGTTNFSSDAKLKFSGTCDMEVPMAGMTILSVSANSGHNMATVKLPLYPNQNRCPKVFPPDAASRLAAATDPSSPYYPCGYSAGVTGGCGNTGPANHMDAYGNQVTDSSGYFIMCDFLRSDSTRTDTTVGCMARLGNYSTTSVAPDGDLMHDQAGHMTGRFGGFQWSPGTYYAWDTTYTNNGKTPTFSFANSAVWGSFCNLLYGKQFVNCKILNVVESGNDTKAEAEICYGDIGQYGIDLVLAQGIQLTEATPTLPAPDPNLYWSFANDGTNFSTGGRNGIALKNLPGYSDGSHSALADPSGSVARILVDVYKDIFTGYGTPTIQVRCNGPLLWVWAPISSISGSGSQITVTFTTNTPNYYLSGAGSYQIIGSSLTAANGAYAASTFNSYTQGPPGTVVLNSSVTGSGTGGYIGFLPQNNGISFKVTNVTSAPLGGGYTVTYTIGSHNILAGQIVTITGIANSGGLFYGAMNRYNATVVSVTSTTITLAQLPNPGTYVSGGVVTSGATNSNPVWILLDILMKCNWRMSEINLQTFITTAFWCDTPIKYIDKNGNTASHERYKCAFVLEERRTAAEVVAGICRCFDGYLYMDENGLLCVDTNRTLADSQPAAIVGSNYNSPVSSIDVYNNAANGYIAWEFNDSNIARDGTGDNERLSIEWVDAATVSTPNTIIINFQDEDNAWVRDSLTQYSDQAVQRAGGALNPGGAIVEDTPSIFGITNFDQGIRIANRRLGELNFGNEFNQAGGTRVAVVKSTVAIEHLRTGHLVRLKLANIGLSQLFRVLKVKPATNFEDCQVTIQWENEVWRTDAYGQAPQTFYSNPGTSGQNRIPHVWQPYGEQPSVPSADNTSGFPLITGNEWTFHLAEIDGTDASGNPLVQVQIGGQFPINQPNAVAQPPRVSGTSIATTGGSIPGGITLLVCVCAIDGSGNYTAASGFLSVQIPSGTSTNQIYVGVVGWAAGTAGYDVFIGRDHWSMTSQLKAATGGTPAAINVTSIPNVQLYAPPDMLAASIEVQGKSVIHAGSIGETVVAITSSTITIGAPASGTFSNAVTGYKLVLLGRPNNSGNNLPEVIFNISSYTVNGDGSVKFTIDRDPTALIDLGDVMVVSAQADINGAQSIGCTMFVSAYSPTGVASTDVGDVVRIVAGKGRFQTRTITSVSSTGGVGNDTYGMDSLWAVQPDATSMFIVEESRWRFTSPCITKAAQSLQDQSLALVDVSNLSGSAILLQPLLVDGTGTLTSSERRSPFRMIWLTGVQGTRVITSTSGGMRRTDRVLRFDTSGVTTTSNTLGAAITTTTQTAITLTSAYSAPNGTVFTVGSGGSAENMYVVSGSGTSSLVVIRNWAGSAAGAPFTFANGTGVTVPGALVWMLTAFAQVLNQNFVFSKTSTDINYVKLVTTGTDQLPDNEAFHVLADTSAAYGTYGFTVPGQ